MSSYAVTMRFPVRILGIPLPGVAMSGTEQRWVTRATSRSGAVAGGGGQRVGQAVPSVALPCRPKLRCAMSGAEIGCPAPRRGQADMRPVREEEEVLSCEPMPWQRDVRYLDKGHIGPCFHKAVSGADTGDLILLLRDIQS